MENDLLKVGDIITAYHAGYHKVVHIRKRYRVEGTRLGDLISYQTIFTKDGKSPGSKRVKACDVHYCDFAIPKIDQQIINLESLKEKIKNYEL